MKILLVTLVCALLLSAAVASGSKAWARARARAHAWAMIDNSAKAQAYKIIQYEARFDKNGNLMVYMLPSGDGGGTYEVAGINDKYHPKAAAALKGMIERKEFATAKDYASQYIADYTDTTDKESKLTGIQFYLRDSSFNRGPTGCAKILQHALGVAVDGKVGAGTLGALRNAEKDALGLLKKLRASREWYERNFAHRDESSKFWKGLVNRWNNAFNDAVAFGLKAKNKTKF
jgi:hypothetical protein